MTIKEAIRIANINGYKIREAVRDVEFAGLEDKDEETFMPELDNDSDKKGKEEILKFQNAFEKAFYKISDCTIHKSGKKDIVGGYETIYAIKIPKEVSRIKNGSDKGARLLNQNKEGLIWLSTQTNPNGITGPNDKGRTYTIKVSFNGEVIPYRRRSSYQGSYAELYLYDRTIEGALNQFIQGWSKKIEPIFESKIRESVDPLIVRDVISMIEEKPSFRGASYDDLSDVVNSAFANEEAGKPTEENIEDLVFLFKRAKFPITKRSASIIVSAIKRV
jgi:hypothetical protein